MYAQNSFTEMIPQTISVSISITVIKAVGPVPKLIPELYIHLQTAITNMCLDEPSFQTHPLSPRGADYANARLAN